MIQVTCITGYGFKINKYYSNRGPSKFLSQEHQGQHFILIRIDQSGLMFGHGSGDLGLLKFNSRISVDFDVWRFPGSLKNLKDSTFWLQSAKTR